MSMQSQESFKIVRKLLPYSTAAALLALMYLGWIFYSRWNERAEAQRAADAKQVEEARKTYELYGSGQLKILLYYASPPVIRRGGSTQLCYSVANATTVKIDQGVEDIKPSLSRCIPVKPSHSLTYTMTAADDKGHTTTKTVDVEVR